MSSLFLKSDINRVFLIHYNYKLADKNVQTCHTHRPSCCPAQPRLSKYLIKDQHLNLPKIRNVNQIMWNRPSTLSSFMICQSSQWWTSPWWPTSNCLLTSSSPSSVALSPRVRTSSLLSRTCQETSLNSLYSNNSSLASLRVALSPVTASATPLSKEWSTSVSRSLNTEKSTTLLRSWRLVLPFRSSRSNRLSSQRKYSLFKQLES